MVSKGKLLGRLSDWSTLVVLAGIVVLPFLPGHATDPVRPAVRAKAPARVASQAVAPTPTAPAPTPPVSDAPHDAPQAKTTPAIAPATPDASAPAAPVPDVWTDAQQAAGLRECLRLLAPLAADVDLEEPIKKGQCGTPAPLHLRSIGATAKVEFHPAPMMNCRLAAQLTRWVETVLQPAAREVLGSRITRIVGASSYSCRNMYSNPKLPLSEHATGAAVDIAGFVTADGRTIRVLKGWGPTERDIAAAQKAAAQKQVAEAKKADATKKKKGAKADSDDTASASEGTAHESAKEEAKVHKAGFKLDERKVVATAAVPLTAAETTEAAFLKRLHHGACAMFGTVLGPEANEAHRNHFHFDVRQRKRRGVCH